jgi:lipopolysaccharide/colanic/teichoic acid biosynthesis glycosyltransferase
LPEPGRAISPLPIRLHRRGAVSPPTPLPARHESQEPPSSAAEERLDLPEAHELDTIGDGLQIRESARAHDGRMMADQDARPPREAVQAAGRRSRINGSYGTNGSGVSVVTRGDRPGAVGSASPWATASPPPAASPQPLAASQADPGEAGTAPAAHRPGFAARRLGFLRDPRLKRAIDVAGSLALIGALSPVLGACAAAVRLTSPGPVLFRQRRIGRQGQPFEMLKFRTMHQNADQSAHQQYVAQLIAGTADAHAADGTTVFKLVGDRRITPAGHWLRRLSLDELPQLINVLRGDMSLVGPRPPLPYEVEHYTPRHLQRLDVTPGITGLWQVSGRSRTTFEEMIDLDLAYIERWSVSLDLQILLRTLPVVVFPDGH